MSVSTVKFGRVIKLNIGDGLRVFTDLRMVFRVERWVGDAIHTMTIDVYNVRFNSRVTTPVLNRLNITLSAGYLTASGLLFAGTITNINTFRSDTDIVTRLYCKDSLITADPIVTLSIDGSRNLNDLITTIALAAGFTVGSLNMKFQNTLRGQHFDKRFSLIMDDLKRSFNFTWHIFNGELFVYDTDAGNLDKQIYTIDATTGLLEHPVLTTLGLNLKLLLTPELRPDDRFVVDSKGVQLSQSSLEFVSALTTGLGDQKVLSLVHTGDTHGDAWYTEIIGQALINPLDVQL